ncbi:MAG: hypothetical protein NZO16_03800 [Deltaproteobacteria bacterium]|nr:hypothetical protein [Deltaproteobacteria bacterium]
MKGIIEHSELLDEKIGEMLKTCEPVQGALRSLNSVFLKSDVALLSADSMKCFLRSFFHWLRWQVEFRIFKEDYFAREREKVAKFMASLQFFYEFSKQLRSN